MRKELLKLFKHDGHDIELFRITAPREVAGGYVLTIDGEEVADGSKQRINHIMRDVYGVPREHLLKPGEII